MTETAQKTIDPRTVQLKGLRLSYTDTLKEKGKPDGVPDADPKYGCNFLIEKAGPQANHFDENVAKVVAALKAAGDQEWGKPDAYKAISEDNPKRVAFRKGERFKNPDGDIYKGYEGNLAISASGPSGGKHRPKMWDRHKRKVEEEDILVVCYGGSYCDAILSFYGTDKGSRGIFCSIEAIRSWQEGDVMGSGITVTADMFDDMPETDAFAGTGAAEDSGGAASLGLG
jgi:hypothetical protein